MLSRALLRSALPTATMLTKHTLSQIPQCTILRQTATYALRLPPMAHQPLPYLHEPRRPTAVETAAETMASGKLVSDEIVAAMLESYLRTNKVQGWVLDGFPRNARQAEMLVSNSQTRPDMVIEIVVDHDDIRQRLLLRRVDPVTGGVYNLSGEIPNGEVLARLERREDDCEEVIERRLRVYEECMPGVRRVFQSNGIQFVKVVAERGASIEEISNQIWKVATGKKVVICGAPGCGKGTQGVLLADMIDGEHISTGDLLRKAARLAREGLGQGVVEENTRKHTGVVARL